MKISFSKQARRTEAGGPGKWATAVLLALLIWVIPAGCLAVTYTLTFECPAAEPQTRIYSRTVEDRYTVCLPGYWDASRLRISFDKPQELQIGDITVHSGDEIDVSGLLGTTLRLGRNGGYSAGTITFCQGSRIPTVQVTVDAKMLAKALKDKNLIIPEGSILVTGADGTVEYDGGLIQFKGRGNATFSNKYPKKPFQFKLEKKADLCGMGKARTWLLIANYLDISLLRNQINLDLAREIGMSGAIECVQADVWLNGVYNGLYLLTEKVQINQNRLNIYNLEEENEALNDQPVESYKRFKEANKKSSTEVRGYELPNEPEDITGGYIIELDKYYRYHDRAKSGFQSSVRLYFVIKEPTCVSRAEAYYISGLFDEFFRGANAADGFDPVTGKYYADMIDMESFAMKFLVEDFAKNVDALGGSQFFYKDRDSVSTKIFAGPCWDYDLCMGNINIAGIANGVRPQNSWCVNIKNGKTNWYAMLYQHPDFQAEVRRVYQEKFRPALAALIGEEGASGEILRSLEEYQSAIAESAAMNWTRFRSQSVPGIYEKSGKTLEAANVYLFNWIRERVIAMDEVYGAAENE